MAHRDLVGSGEVEGVLTLAWRRHFFGFWYGEVGIVVGALAVYH